MPKPKQHEPEPGSWESIGARWAEIRRIRELLKLAPPQRPGQPEGLQYPVRPTLPMRAALRSLAESRRR